MDERVKWVKPNGTELMILNEKNNIATAKGLGWKPFNEKKPQTNASASEAITTEQK